MTKLLLRFFVKSKDYSAPKTRAAVGRLSGAVGIASNILLFLGKLTVGTVSGSVSITADAMNNLTDASSAIVTLIGFKLAEKPADEDHPYGHARFEYLSGLAVAALILIIGFELAKSSVGKILHPTAVTFSAVTAGVLVASVLIKAHQLRHPCRHRCRQPQRCDRHHRGSGCHSDRTFHGCAGGRLDRPCSCPVYPLQRH